MALYRICMWERLLMDDVQMFSPRTRSRHSISSGTMFSKETFLGVFTAYSISVPIFPRLAIDTERPIKQANSVQQGDAYHV